MDDREKATKGEGMEDMQGLDTGTNEGNWREMGHNTKDAQRDAIHGRERKSTQGAFGEEEEPNESKQA